MNKIMLIGNVGKEPDVRYFDADQSVATFPLATTERGYTLPNGTQVPDRTDWHNVVLWRGLAKLAEKYIHKGDKLYVEGKIQYRHYDDNKGKNHFICEVVVDNIELLSPRTVQPGKNLSDNVNKQTNNPTNEANGNEENLPF